MRTPAPIPVVEAPPAEPTSPATEAHNPYALNAGYAERARRLNEQLFAGRGIPPTEPTGTAQCDGWDFDPHQRK
ncbi:MAG: hypothetical protein NVV60_00570 [Luteimonas sp.]|nr:hypothetical protein [Luteimonas sp.]